KIENIQLPENIGQQLWQNNAEAAFNFRYFIDGIQQVDSTSQAARIGLKKDDKIVSINGIKPIFFDQISSELFKNKGKKVKLEIKSGDSISTKEFILNKKGVLGFVPKLSISTDTNAVFTKKYSFGESFASGFSKGYKSIYANIAQFKYVFSKKGAESIGGFGSIGKLFPTTWNWQAFWTMTAFLSMMLAIMNLLPIPALDGGHVVFLIYEMVSGKPPGQRFMEIAQYTGFFILMALILYANGKDLINALFH
ncbi:MAG TPA: M50 family metallopeptidase, partial [Fluviicola sp.]|nr:M50 family metallopeptidase [Fluviicola sp.]